MTIEEMLQRIHDLGWNYHLQHEDYVLTIDGVNQHRYGFHCMASKKGDPFRNGHIPQGASKTGPTEAVAKCLADVERMTAEEAA